MTHTLLKKTICECGQPIMVLQGPDSQITAMHKKPACRDWEQKRTAAFNAHSAERLGTQATNRHARRRAEALARRGVKP